MYYIYKSQKKIENEIALKFVVLVVSYFTSEVFSTIGTFRYISSREVI